MLFWLQGIVGVRIAKPLLIGLGVPLLVVLVFAISHCTRDNTAEEEQAIQATRTSEAYSNAVAFGVSTIDNRAVTESALAEATVVVKDEIGNAASLSDIRNSLVTRLCAQPSHKKDAACAR